MTARIGAFVQARMSSRRFPGKVLAPFLGEPLIRRVLAAVAEALPSVGMVVLTSEEASDDPLALYLGSLGVRVFRGPLDNVFERFRKCAVEHPCEWILRVNGDSPLLDPRILQAVADYAGSGEVDLITTIFPRTFPRGHNAELIRVDTLLEIEASELSQADCEHVTRFFYRHRERFRIMNVESGDASLAALSFAVDSVNDLHRLESEVQSGATILPYEHLVAREA